MQVIYRNENKRSCSRRTNLVDIIIYVGELRRYMKRKSIGELKNRSIGI